MTRLYRPEFPRRVAELVALAEEARLGRLDRSVIAPRAQRIVQDTLAALLVDFARDYPTLDRARLLARDLATPRAARPAGRCA